MTFNRHNKKRVSTIEFTHMHKFMYVRKAFLYGLVQVCMYDFKLSKVQVKANQVLKKKKKKIYYSGFFNNLKYFSLFQLFQILAN